MPWANLLEFIIKYWVQVALGGITTAGGVMYKRITAQRKKDKLEADAARAEADARHKAVQAGVEALLADRLIQLQNYYRDKGYCPIRANLTKRTNKVRKERVEESYEKRKKLDRDVPTGRMGKGGAGDKSVTKE